MLYLGLGKRAFDDLLQVFEKKKKMICSTVINPHPLPACPVLQSMLKGLFDFEVFFSDVRCSSRKRTTSRTGPPERKPRQWRQRRGQERGRRRPRTTRSQTPPAHPLHRVIFFFHFFFSCLCVCVCVMPRVPTGPGILEKSWKLK